MGSEAEESDGVPFEEKKEQLTTELASQFAESALLEKKILEKLAGFGLRFKLNIISPLSEVYIILSYYFEIWIKYVPLNLTYK